MFQPEQIFAGQCLASLLGHTVVSTLVTLNFPVVPKVTNPFVPVAGHFLSLAECCLHFGVRVQVLSGRVVLQTDLIAAFHWLASLAHSSRTLRTVHDPEAVRVSFITNACDDLLPTTASVVRGHACQALSKMKSRELAGVE